MADIQALYEAYIAKAEQLERDKKPGDGLLGLTSGPKDDPCHEQFAADLEALLKEMRARRPSSEEIREALAYVYRMPLEHRQPLTVYWMLQAVHGMTADLAELLAAQDAQALRDAYARDYRRWERLPAQRKALAALDRARKGN